MLKIALWIFVPSGLLWFISWSAIGFDHNYAPLWARGLYKVSRPVGIVSLIVVLVAYLIGAK